MRCGIFDKATGKFNGTGVLTKLFLRIASSDIYSTNRDHESDTRITANIYSYTFCRNTLQWVIITRS